ncbi:MAG: 1,4-alpha-glucan branching protein GlgB [Pseudomonadota bacterium]
MKKTVRMDELAGCPEQIAQLLAGDCSNPHALLGVHPTKFKMKQGLVVRVYHPEAVDAYLLIGGKRISMQSVKDGLFVVFLPESGFPLSYEVEFSFFDGRSHRRVDPYKFPPTLGDLDLHLSGEGRHYALYKRLGAHPRTIDSVTGASFAVWAPNARRVSVVGSFNHWDGHQHPMRQMGSTGIWELFVPGVERGELYKFEIKTKDGSLLTKSDPLGFFMELRPQTASVVWGLGAFHWRDDQWIANRKLLDFRRQPVAIYEVHLGSWMRAPDRGHAWLNYRDLADRLVAHAKDHGFTHLELLPIAEHAYDPSWGYQTTGFFAPTCRFGEPEDLKYLVDLCHRNNIGVILDWVPGHFPKDAHGLARFDGTALYEHVDPRKGEHREWGTLIFNYGRHEVRSFLISNALYWLEQFHVDGLRVDAVASMLYLDYDREEGEWIPNRFGGRENEEAILFLRELHTVLKEKFPGVFTIAEESTAWPGVTLPVQFGGLGFDFKWDMGWMHDTLEYFSKEPIHRSFHHRQLTFRMLYAYSENFILPLSHDEVVHLKGSLLSKMPGDDWQKAANLRLLLACLYLNSGKKLLFMGGEFGQVSEWNHDHSLDWHLAGEPRHAGIQRFVKELGALYQQRDALWAWDVEPRGFRWIDCNDYASSVISFARFGPGGHLVCVFNFTPVPREHYRIGFPKAGFYREIFNTDSIHYGGTDVGNSGRVETQNLAFHGMAHSAEITLPPLGALVFEPG